MMRQKREHLIGACPPDGDEVSGRFALVVEQSKNNFDGKILLAREPPPERDIYLEIRLTNWEELSSISLGRFFGLAIDANMMFEPGSAWMRHETFLDGIVSRLPRDNDALEFYGIKISVFAEGLDDDQCAYIYSFFHKWCEERTANLKVPFVFDLAHDRNDFNRIMFNEHLRMKHGDIKRQFAGISK